MIKVVLAGTYPLYTYEKIRTALPEDQFTVQIVESQEELNTMTDAEIIILRILKAPRSVIENKPNLMMIMRWGAGFDSVDIEAAGEHGVWVTNTPGANAIAVSELAILFMLALGRKVMNHKENLQNGIWSKNQYLDQSFCLNQKLVGIIGGGNIGRQVAGKAQAFGAKVQYYDAFRLPKELEEECGIEYVPLQTLLETSDIVSLHVPLLDTTRHMIGEKEIASMKTGAMIINTARGGLIDDYALAKAVREGKLSGAALDGVEREPLKKDDELLHNANIIVTPHIGGGTADIGDIIIPMLVKDIQLAAQGHNPLHVVNQKYLIK